MRVLLLCVLLLAGCDAISPTTADSALETIEVRTDAGSYSRAAANVSATVSFVIENRGSRAVAVQRCGERVMAALDRRSQDGWVQYSGDACPATQSMVPLELASGARAGGSIAVQQAGTYRLRLGVDRGGGAQVMWTVTSNEFVVQ